MFAPVFMIVTRQIGLDHMTLIAICLRIVCPWQFFLQVGHELNRVIADHDSLTVSEEDRLHQLRPNGRLAKCGIAFPPLS